MLRILEKNETIETTPIGGFCPYWIVLDGKVIIADTAGELVSMLPAGRRIIDPVSVFELLQFNYMLGTRTLIQGIGKMPWRAALSGEGVLTRKPPLPHGNLQMDPRQAAHGFRARLESELLSVLKRHPRVYLLLSGGLDSRIVAGTVKKIEPQAHATIECVTWGNESCRDVAYARTIASWYDWNFISIPYDAELTWENIQREALWGGSEIAGIHLHGMDWFKCVQKESCVIAASFGDSIGRAEFSSRHLTKLQCTPLRNIGDFLHPRLEKTVFLSAESDRATAWEKEDTNDPIIRCELDMQENYMRRMISHAMDYIRQFCSLHQAFTSPEVVRFMWSLSPQCRTDEMYMHVLKQLDTRLYSLPWARTGRAPSGEKNPNDENLKKEYHQWGMWLRNELRDRLADHYFSPQLYNLGIMNTPARSRLWKCYCKESGDTYWAAQNVVKVCSIELSRAHFQIDACRNPTPFLDYITDVIRRGNRKRKSIFGSK